VARIMSRELATDRPLWELNYIEGLADGRAAGIFKVHHALADGVSGGANYVARARHRSAALGVELHRGPCRRTGRGDFQGSSRSGGRCVWCDDLCDPLWCRAGRSRAVDDPGRRRRRSTTVPTRTSHSDRRRSHKAPRCPHRRTGRWIGTRHRHG